MKKNISWLTSDIPLGKSIHMRPADIADREEGVSRIFRKQGRKRIRMADLMQEWERHETGKGLKR